MDGNSENPWDWVLLYPGTNNPNPVTGGLYVLEKGTTVTSTGDKGDTVYGHVGKNMSLLAGNDSFNFAYEKGGGSSVNTYFPTAGASVLDGGTGWDALGLQNLTAGNAVGIQGDLVIDYNSVKYFKTGQDSLDSSNLQTVAWHQNFESFVVGNLRNADFSALSYGIMLTTENSFDRFARAEITGTNYSDTFLIDTARRFGGSYNNTNQDDYLHEVTGDHLVTVNAGVGNDYVAGELVDGAVYIGGAGHDTFEILASDGADGAVTTFLDLQSGASSQVRSVWWYGTNYVSSDTTATVTGFEWAVGSYLADTIYALNTGARIAGGAGNDNLHGGAGNDVIMGGTGNDTITDLEGQNLIDGGDGNDIINLGHASNEVHGGNGNDRIGSGHVASTLYGGFGTDTITAGNGNDTIDAGGHADVVTVAGGHNTISLGGDVDVLTAGAGNDTVSDIYGSLASSNWDVINEAVREPAKVYLDGGAGHDRLTIDYSGAAITFLDDPIFNSTGFNYSFRTGVREQHGSVWEWNDPNNTQLGGQYVWTYRTQHITNFEDIHLTNGTFTVDLISYADLDADFCSSIASHDIHTALQTWDNDDTVALGAGNDTFFASLGNDTVAGEDHTDWLDMSRLGAGYSTDALTLADDGSALVTIRDSGAAVAGTVTATGFEGLAGTAQAEAITTGSGANLLRGYGGNDTLTGGAGADRFYFGSADGNDTITDIEIGDVIVLDSGTGTFAQSGSAGAYSYSVTSGSTVVQFTSTALLDVSRATANGALEMTVVDGVLVARDDSAATDEDTAVTIDVLANDTDPGLANMAITAFDSTSAKGANIQRDGNTGRFTYDPGAVFDGLIDGQSDTDSFTYTVADSFASRTATVTIDISGFTDNPVAYADSAAVLEDGTVTIDAKANDLDPGAADSTVTAFDATATGGGRVVHQGNGVFAYTPGSAFTYLAEGETATDSFTYTISDGRYASTVTVTVTGQDDAYTLANDSRVVLEDHTATIDVLANDSDPDTNDTLTLTAVGTPNVGTAEIVGGQIRYTPTTNYNGPVSFTYDASDGRTTQTATVNLTYVPVDDPVTIVNDAYTFTVGRGPFVMDVTANDVDPEGGGVHIWGANAYVYQYGAVAIVDNKVQWTPAAAYDTPGTYQFGYGVRDDAGHVTYNGEITVTLIAEAGPNVFNTNVALNEDQSYLFNPEWIWSNSDPNGDTVSLVSFQHNMANATVTDHGNNTFTITPDKDWFGTEYATVTLTDGTHVVSYVQGFTFRSVPDPITAVPDVLRTAPDTALRFADTALSANDTGFEANHNGWMVTLGNVQNGALSGVAGQTTLRNLSASDATFAGLQINYDAVTGGDAIFTPTAGFHGAASFQYKYITQLVGSYGVSTGDVTVMVDTDATAVDDGVTIFEDASVTHNVLSNDSDADGDTLILHDVTGATNGTVSFTAAGAVTYSPNANWSGTEVLTTHVGSQYQSKTVASTATLTVTVAAVDDPVTAVADSATTAEDTSVTINVIANDTNPDGRASSVLSITDPANGTLSGTAGVYTYTPDANWHGTDSFTYTREDGLGGTTTGTGTVTVTPVNDAPLAVTDTLSTAEDTPNAVMVLTNDTDADGDTLTITGFGTATHGTIDRPVDNVLVYYPNANWHGSDSFTYTLSDGIHSTTGTVNVTVTPANDVPDAAPIAVTLAEDTSVTVDVTPYLSDIDGDTVWVNSSLQPFNGTGSFNGNVLTFTPNANWNGTELTPFSITDGQADRSVQISLTVTPVNDAPVASGDSLTVNAGGIQSFAPLSNDSDVDGDSLTITAIDGRAIVTGQTIGLGGGASVTLGEGNVLNVASGPNHGALLPGQTSATSFDYTVSDPSGLTSTASVQVTIAGINDAPSARPDALTVVEDGSGSINVMTKDGDVDGDSFTLTGVSTPANGSVSFAADGQVTFTPNADWAGTETLTYTLTDSEGASAQGTLTVTATQVNDAPQTSGSYAAQSGVEDTTLVLDLSGVTITDIDSAVTLTLSGTQRNHVENTPLVLEPGLTLTSPDLAYLNGGAGGFQRRVHTGLFPDLPEPGALQLCRHGKCLGGRGRAEPLVAGNRQWRPWRSGSDLAQ